MKSIEYTVEYAKIFINLASLLLGLSITFAGTILGISSISVFAVSIAWAFWIFSILTGSYTVRKIVSIVADVEDAPDEPISRRDSIFGSNVSTLLNVQVMLFLGGFAVMAWITVAQFSAPINVAP